MSATAVVHPVLAAVAELNWIAVAIAFVIAAAIAAVYFPVLVAKPYAVALGREDAPKAPSSLVTNLGPVICIAVVTVTTAILLRALDVTAVGEALIVGLVVGVGYLTAMTFQIAINPAFPRPLLYGLINAPYFVVVTLIQVVILTLIR